MDAKTEIKNKLIQLALDYDNVGSLLAFGREAGISDEIAYTVIDEAIKSKMIEVRVDHSLGSSIRRAGDMYLAGGSEVCEAVKAGELYLWFEPSAALKLQTFHN